MLCIQLKNEDPFFCLAAEEYLLKNFAGDIFMLWQSKNAVVVGKHQNAMAEINYPYVHHHHITVARRISGGGTVFHDEGNVNFAFIKNVSGPSEISFRRFVQPVIDALGELEVQAVTSGRNDLLAGDKKISGNAEHIFKNRVLHHGTLLFDSNLETLGQSIKVIPGKYQGKAVQSNRSVVTNIRPLLKKPMDLGGFISFLMDFHLRMPGSTVYELNEADMAAVHQLAVEKFSTWEWNFGYSPAYICRNERVVEGKKLGVELTVEKGYVVEAHISGNYFPEIVKQDLSLLLKGQRHFYGSIGQTLEDAGWQATDELIFTFF